MNEVKSKQNLHNSTYIANHSQCQLQRRLKHFIPETGSNQPFRMVILKHNIQDPALRLHRIGMCLPPEVVTTMEAGWLIVRNPI